jgi:hypothetical protein
MATKQDLEKVVAKKFLTPKIEKPKESFYYTFYRRGYNPHVN